MNYPLAEAIVSFAGGSRLDMDMARTHSEYGANIRPMDGPGFASRVAEIAGTYDPATVAVQFNLLGSHDTPRLRSVLGGDPAGVRLATLFQATLPGAPCVYYGDENGLTGGADPQCRGAFPWDPAAWETGIHDATRALFHLRAAEPGLRDSPTSVAGATGAAVAFERGAGTSRFIVAANAGDDAIDLTVRLADADAASEPATRPSRLTPIELPGIDGAGPAAIVDGQATITLAGRSGGLLRVG
jgi:neopullulanase